MIDPVVNLSPIPTGGAVMLAMPGYSDPGSPSFPATSVQIYRTVTGKDANIKIYDGPPISNYLDVGDLLPGPLDPTVSYTWTVIDNLGRTTVGPITPSSSVTTTEDWFDNTFIRLLQGGINSLTLPSDFGPPPIVSTQMPQNGWPALPFIVVNTDLIQQTEVSIGEDVPSPDQNNNWTLWANAKRVWRVTIMAINAEQRNFYRDALLVIFRVVKATAFSPLGLDVEHKFQAASYTDANEWEGKTPGFYGADLMLEVDGRFPTAILTNYGPVTNMDVTINGVLVAKIPPGS